MNDKQFMCSNLRQDVIFEIGTEEQSGSSCGKIRGVRVLVGSTVSGALLFGVRYVIFCTTKNGIALTR